MKTFGTPESGQVRVVLSINVGSSSVKFALFEFSNDERRLAEGAIERIGLEGSHLWLRVADRPPDRDDRHFEDSDAAIAAAFGAMKDKQLPEPGAVGHRLVHGGPHHSLPERVDQALLRSLAEVVPFAPLHLPPELAAIKAVAARFPKLPQVACFDTAFHRTLPEVARRLALPRALDDQGIRKYGFHGLSYEYVVAKVGPDILGRAVIAHLGNGASLAAVRNGESIDTSMGLTPTGGVMMGTRTGDLDPGVLVHLLNAGYDAGRLERMVDHESGLLGVSGISSDMKELIDHRKTDARAALAVDMFGYQIRKAIGALTAALGGLDTLVFTGGIGAFASPVRAICCAGLECLGIDVDVAKNEASASVISKDGSACVVRIVPTDEELMVARHTLRLA